MFLAPAGPPVPLVGRGPWLDAAGAGWCLAMFKVGMADVLGVSLSTVRVRRVLPDPVREPPRTQGAQGAPTTPA